MQERLQYIQDLVSQGLTDQEIKIKLAEFDNQPGKLKDPVKETAIAGSANTSSTDLNLDNGLLESAIQKNKEKFKPFDPKSLSLPQQQQEKIPLEDPKTKQRIDTIQKAFEEKQNAIVVANNKQYRGRISGLLKTNTPYQLGIDGSSITEIYQNNPNLLEKELKTLLKNQYQANYNQTLPDQTVIDDIVRAEIGKVIDFETRDQQIEETNRLKKLGEDEQQQAQIDEIEKNYISGFTEKQQKFVNLNQQKSDLEAEIKNIDDIEEKKKAILKYRELAAQSDEAWNAMEKAYGAKKFFDKNGKRISEIEAKEIDDVENYDDQYETIKTKYNSFEYGELEKQFSLWALDKQNLNESLNRTIDLKAKDFLSMGLYSQGYRPDENGIYRGVRYKDILQWRRQPELLNDAIYTDEKEDQLLPDLANELSLIHKDRININLRAAALD